jgi:hypothetical protein
MFNEIELTEDDFKPTEEEIGDMWEELHDKIWYDRSLSFDGTKDEVKPTHPSYKGMMEARKRIEDRYGIENLGPYDDFEWGEMMGKFRMLNWMLGYGMVSDT